jgi:glycine/D-amino acid oxidase-like deaminating enzyme/nitrite reductase/ring-hydroxylating ferredoxin subunit
MRATPGPDKSSGTSASPWIADAWPIGSTPLSTDLEADVCVVGGGIAGVTTAFLTLLEGRSVVLLEDGALGSGETGRTTAHLASALDDRFSRLERLHGEEGARLAYQSHAAAIDLIEFLVEKHRIECGFERLDGYLFVPPGEPADLLDEELEAARRIGVRGVRPLRRAPLEGFDTGRCLVFPDQAQFHPLQYLRAISGLVLRHGGQIFERTHVEDLESSGRVIVKAAGGHVVRARAAVIATHAPVVSRVSVPLRQFAYRSYVVGLRIPKGAVSKGLYWDTADPYHYVRLQNLGTDDLLIVGGEDHKTGQPEGEDPQARYARLETWARERFPRAGTVEYLWSGQIMEPADGLAFIGRHRPAGDNVFVVTGDSGHGMTHGTIAGLLLRDLIAGRENRWAEIYDPARVTLRSIGEVARENLNVIPQYGKWLTGGETKTTRDIPRGEGRVLRQGLKKIACYRDETGGLCVLSAACPHLGAVLSWNPAEKTWDCPAHGSRFSASGKVINGPANSDLKRLAPSRLKPAARRRRPA